MGRWTRRGCAVALAMGLGLAAGCTPAADPVEEAARPPATVPGTTEPPAPAPAPAPAPDGLVWTPLFNGRDLTGWTPKITGQALGADPLRTFRVEDGTIHVAYDDYETFDGRFGHLFFMTPHAHYRLRLEYRFTGEQTPGGPGWAFRNSGVMIHGQDAETMRVDQDFPASIEVQLLGGPEAGVRPTGNLCTPGTHVEMNGALHKQHCTNSTSETFRGDDWVQLEIEVRGNEVIRHFINGALVLEYEKPQLDENDPDAAGWIERRGGAAALAGGSISLQAESHPCAFRNIELALLEEREGE